ncbi:MAG: HU family DNA-binding protein [Elusimicrobia bacterium]|jgi:DNA-binding protein HU-beta|nr:HU family DNA-binding protein [Elusimicrobiota bacterium]
MNKSEIIEKVSNVTCAKIEAADAVEALFESIKDALEIGERVTVSGFGSFYVQFRKAKKGRNPQTGERIDIPPKKVIKFKPSPQLNDKLN